MLFISHVVPYGSYNLASDDPLFLLQINIVETCQNLGVGPGGFYQPGYKDGAKLRLQMMCLGLDWDPQTRKYENKRAVDGNRPPDIPSEFSILVKRALKDAHALIKNECNTSNIEDILPLMSPDICIVNFYTTNGRLGLHQVGACLLYHQYFLLSSISLIPSPRVL